LPGKNLRREDRNDCRLFIHYPYKMETMLGEEEEEKYVVRTDQEI
jgi:hypothetical protein